MQASSRPTRHPQTLIPDPRHTQPRHLPNLLLNAFEASAISLLAAEPHKSTLRHSIIKAYFHILRRITSYLFPPDSEIREVVLLPDARVLLGLKVPDIDYAEFAQYDTLQREFKEEANGNTAEFEWKTAFLDLCTERELLERYVDWTAEEIAESWNRSGATVKGREEQELLKGLQQELLVDFDDVVFEQEMNRSRFGKDGDDEGVLWKRIVRLREETLKRERVAGEWEGEEVRSVLEKYEGEREWELRGVGRSRPEA